MSLLKRLIAWMAAALPVGVAAGASVSAYWGPDAAVDRATAAVNGALAGFWLGLIGAVAAAVTTRAARDPLRRAGGSEVATGAVIVGGLLAAGLAFLTLA